MKFKRKVFLETGKLDLAPLIDVIFLLLIFFMLTSSFIFQPGIRVNLPKAVTSEVLHKELLIVTVTKDNEIFVNERPVSSDEMISRITVAGRKASRFLLKRIRKRILEKLLRYGMFVVRSMSNRSI